MNQIEVEKGGSLREHFWKNHINSWQNSGWSQAHYRRIHALDKYSFRYWKHRFLPKAAPQPLIPIEIHIECFELRASPPVKIVRHP